jgi:S-adenosylmethionine hydrolase
MRPLALLAPLLVVAACSAPEHKESPPQAKPRPIVVLMTDFGLKDDAVSLLRGVVLSICRDATIADLTHEVPVFDVEAGARLLEDSPALYPPGSVFVVVVDPGVGTARKAMAVLLKNGSYLIGPDNGVLAPTMERYGVQEVRAIENPKFMLSNVSTTFHGRDVFSPSGAHLALGSPPFAEIGPVLDTWIKLPRHAVEAFGPLTDEAVKRKWTGLLKGEIVAIDEPFGNVWTNVTEKDLAGLPGSGNLVFEVGDKTVAAPLVHTFGDVPEGKPLAYWSSRGRLALALNMGDAARTYGIKRGQPLVLHREP